MKTRIFILLLVSVWLCSCSIFKAPDFERVQEVQLKDLTIDLTKLNLSIVINNPNWYGITVKSLDIDVMDKSRNKLGNIVMTKHLKISKHAADTVYFEILMDTRKVARLLSYSSDKVEFIVKATALAKVFFISKKIHYEQPNEINFTKILENLLPGIPSEFEIPTIHTTTKKTTTKTRKYVVRDPDIKPVNSSPVKPDIFKVIKTSITNVGFKETELTIRFAVLNPYGFAFKIRDFPSEVRINDKLAGKGKLAKPIVLNENVMSADGELIFDLNNFTSILLTSSALAQKDMNYIVTGNLLAEGFGIKVSKPFKFKGTVQIGKKD